MTDRSQFEPMSPVMVDYVRPNVAAIAWIASPAQIVLTGFITYVAFGAVAVIGGTYTEGLQAITLALFFSTPLTIFAFLVGLPLRLVPVLRRWWFRHAAWSFALLGLAAGAMWLSYFIGDAGPVHWAETVGWPATDGYLPDKSVFYPSLVVAAFASMHLLPPVRRWRL